MIYSLVTRRIEDVPPGDFPTGVTRFDSYLRRVFPDLWSLTPDDLPAHRFGRDDVVICDNHLSLLVPDDTPTIVVHHGCAAAHWDADPTWRTPQTKAIVVQQAEMLTRPNRLYVAPSSWVRDEFARRYELTPDYARVIVNWVPVIESIKLEDDGMHNAVILHDARDANKGASLVRDLATWVHHCDFRPLRCKTDAERVAAYLGADLYLCVSASEGGSYSMADAEAARLPIVTTECGNARDFTGTKIVPRDERLIGLAITSSDVLTNSGWERPERSFYDDYTFEVWANLWRQAVEDVRCKSRSALLPG